MKMEEEFDKEAFYEERDKCDCLDCNEKEFDLSEKIRCNNLLRKDVKEAVRLLKEELGYDGYFEDRHPSLFKRIDKIFGDKLIGANE